MNSPSKLLLTLPERIDAAHTAVLVVDMQNDFCAPGGYIDRVMKKDPGTCSSVAAPINELVTSARKAGAPVIWLCANYSHDSLPEPMRVKLIEMRIKDTCCAPGSWGYEWHGVHPQSGEPVVEKRCYDGFVGTELEAMLRKRGIRTLIFVGVQTHICVETTLRHAHSLGFYCVIAEDCVASHTPPAHQAALNIVRYLLGDVMTMPQIVQAWAGAKQGA